MRRILLVGTVLAALALATTPAVDAQAPVSCQSYLSPAGDGFIQQTYRNARDFYNETCQPLVDQAYDNVCFLIGC